MFTLDKHLHVFNVRCGAWCGRGLRGEGAVFGSNEAWMSMARICSSLLPKG